MSAKPRKKVKTALAPIDPDVKIPRRVRWDAARTDRYYQPGSQYFPSPNPPVAPSKLEIDEALERWAPEKDSPVYPAGGLLLTDPDFWVIQYVLRDYRTLKSKFRKGGQRPRKPSLTIIRQLEATVEVYRGLSPKLQKYPTGTKTIEKLRAGVIKKLGMTDGDDDLPEDVVRKNVSELKVIFRLVRQGIIPPRNRP